MMELREIGTHWIGCYFYDASGGWIYHVELGWLFEEGENGNYWLYDSELGWLWTGPGISIALLQIVISTRSVEWLVIL